jgi:DNA-binding NarL/FixJ family response regulator
LSETTIRVAIAQSTDRPIARAGLCQLLSGAPFCVVGEAVGKEAALTLVGTEHPDIVLVDTFECDGAALDLIASVAEAENSSRVVVLTACSDATIQGRVVSNGALGIIRQEQPPETLYKAIKSVYAGEIWLERALTASVLQKKTRFAAASVSDPQSRIATLSEREHEVIALVCEGLKNQTIAERLYVSEATVRHRLTAIFEKLKVADRLELVIFAFQHGLAALPHVA